MPLSQSDFKKLILEFRKSNVGFQYENDRSLGFIDDKLQYFEIKAKSIGLNNLPYEDKFPIYKKW